MIEAETLIISDTMDFSTDFICIELQKRCCKYLRVNRDMFQHYKVQFNINDMQLKINIDNNSFLINQECLKSVYYRAPIYLSYVPLQKMSLEMQLYKFQWTAFIRDLTVFEKTLWMNNPINTFKSENKILQLKYAENLGFNVPKTLLINSAENIHIDNGKHYIIKTLDTALLRKNKKEAFIYSNIIKGEDLKNYDLSISPLFLQESINPKLDIRVTVVGNDVFAVSITKNKHGIDGDWRREKGELEYNIYELPDEVKIKCVQITKNFGLNFSGIDLIYDNNIFYFIEINPTGEWAWMVKQPGLKIDKSICDYLTRS